MDNTITGLQSGIADPNIDALHKALTAEHVTGTQTWNQTNLGIAPLKIEDLSPNISTLSYQLKDLTVLGMIPKTVATNTVVEYALQVDYGSETGAFLTENGTPVDVSSSYTRRSELVKYIAVQRSITVAALQASVVGGADVVQKETENAIVHISKISNEALIYGDAALIPTQWNGLIAQHKNNPEFNSLDAYLSSDVILDLRGSRMKPEHVERALENARNRYANPTTLLTSNTVLTNWTKNFHESKNEQHYSPINFDGTYRNKAKGFDGQFGSVDFRSDLYFTKKKRYTTNAAQSLLAPNNPVPDGVSPAVVAADATTKFTDGAGTYFYGVAAINGNGESQIVQLGAGLITVTTAQSVDLKFTAAGGGTAATGFVIYRSEKNPTGTIASTPLYPIFTVTAAQLATGYDGGAVGVIRDKNRFVANTNEAFVFEPSLDFWEMKEYLKMSKENLPSTAMARPFVTRYFATPVVKTPGKAIRLINIGDIA